MGDTLKGLIISMGIGFVVGAVVTASNKKFQATVKEAGEMAQEKIDMAKKGIEKLQKSMEQKKPAAGKSTQSAKK